MLSSSCYQVDLAFPFLGIFTLRKVQCTVYLHIIHGKFLLKIKWHLTIFQKVLGHLLQLCLYNFVSSVRVGERNGPSPQNGEPGNTKQQHISSKATTSHHNEVKCFHRRVQQDLLSKSSTVIRSLPIKMEDRSQKCFQIPLVLSKCSRTTIAVINKEMKFCLRRFRWELPGKHL